MSKKKDKDLHNKIYLEFIGNNANEVTGSSIYVKAWDKNLERYVQILLECGLYQGKSIAENYTNNTRLLDKIDAKNIDFVLITHQNLDHVGLTCGLVNRGFTGKILMTKECKSFAIPMLKDSAYISETEVEWLKKNKKAKDKNYKPLYKIADVETTQGLIETVELNKMIELTPNISVKFVPNTHMLGSASFSIHFKDLSSRIHKLYYSGDLGDMGFGKILTYGEQRPPLNATVALIESTYGAREKNFVNKNLRKKELEILEKTIENTIFNKSGAVLMPAFSMDRTEQLLYNLKKICDNNDKLSKLKIVVDGKLTNELLDVYERICEGENKQIIDDILNWENLIRIRDYKETCKMLEETDGKVILSSSGMCSNGHVLSYLRKLLPQKRNTVIFSGYCGENTNGYKIKNKDQTHQKTIKVDGNITLMNAEIVVLDSFSSHIQRNSTMSFVKQINIAEGLYLIHGEMNGKEDLKEDLEKIFEDECISTKVIIPKKNQVIYF